MDTNFARIGACVLAISLLTSTTSFAANSSTTPSVAIRPMMPTLHSAVAPVPSHSPPGVVTKPAVLTSAPAQASHLAIIRGTTATQTRTSVGKTTAKVIVNPKVFVAGKPTILQPKNSKVIRMDVGTSDASKLTRDQATATKWDNAVKGAATKLERDKNNRASSNQIKMDEISLRKDNAARQGAQAKVQKDEKALAGTAGASATLKSDARNAERDTASEGRDAKRVEQDAARISNDSRGSAKLYRDEQQLKKDEATLTRVDEKLAKDDAALTRDAKLGSAAAPTPIVTPAPVAGPTTPAPVGDPAPNPAPVATNASGTPDPNAPGTPTPTDPTYNLSSGAGYYAPKPIPGLRR